MAGIRIRDFKGEIPRRNRTLLPQGFAERASGARLEDGSLKPYRAPVVHATVPENTKTILKHNGTWLHWPSMVHAEQGAVAQDRLYYTGDGAPKLRASGNVYPLALHSPVASLTATPVNPQVIPTPNDPSTAIDWTGFIPPPVSASGPAPGSPHRLAVVRQPVGGINGRVLVTQPAIGLFDRNGDLCTTVQNFEVGVRVSRETGGSITGTRSARSVDGIVRFTDLIATQASNGPVILEFFATDFLSVNSAEISLATDLAAFGKDILFTYTFVTEFDEESAPAPLSQPLLWYPGLKVSLAGWSIAPSGRAINRVRFYRSETSTLGITDLYFIAEATIASLGPTFVYDDILHPLAEILPSNDFDPIPDSYEGLITLPNGVMAAYSGREIGFCEPFIHHAWPVKYRQTVDSEIMGLVPIGSTMVILTKNSPYIAQGFSPETMRLEKIDQSMPCVSKRSVVDLGYAAAFASNDGLALIGQSNGATLVSKALFTHDQWQDMQPETISAIRYRDQYVFSFRHVDGRERDATCFVSLNGDTPFVSFVNFLSETLYTEPESGAGFFVRDNAIMEFDSRRSRPVPYTWKSGCYMLSVLLNFGAIMVRTDGSSGRFPESIEVDVYADDTKIITISEANQPVRLPGDFLSDKWQFEIRGTMSVVELVVAGSFEDLISA